MSHFTKNHRVLYCVAGGAAFGAAAALTIAHFFKPSVCDAEKSSPQSSSTGTNKKLTLHVYDHCPYCVRVELALGWKGISFERKVYGYGDTLGSNKGKYYGGRTLTGHKALPVLEIHGRTPALMPESGDIMKYAEGMGPVTAPQVMGSLRDDLKQFLDKTDFQKFRRILCKPIAHCGGMSHLKDWAKEEDTAYAREKYISSGFDYEAAQKPETQQHARREMENLLESLAALMHSDEYMTGSSYSYDDIVILSALRSLSAVKNLTWPEHLKQYFLTALSTAGVASYFDVAK